MRKSKAIQALQIVAHAFFLRPFVKLFFGVNVAGRENLQGLDRFIIIANHNSHLDICLLFHVLPLGAVSKMHAVADKIYFSKSRVLFRFVSFLFKPIWVERGDPDAAQNALCEAKARLDTGDSIIVFPEGTRGDPGELQHFRSGIGRLVAECPHLPIVPVFLSGSERALPKKSVLPLPFCNSIVIGPPQVHMGPHRDITRSLESSITELHDAESAYRHKRVATNTKSAPIIAFIGIDGSGKSLLSKKIAEALSADDSVCLVSDHLQFFEQSQRKEIQPLMREQLRELIGGYAKKAKSLKLYKIPKMAELLLRDHLLGEAQRWYHPDVILIDGSPLLNMIAWAVLYTNKQLREDMYSRAVGVLSGKASEIDKGDPIFVEFPELLAMRRLKLTSLRLPDMAVYLDVNPATACERISSRGEKRQVHETEEKLRQLQEAYRIVCKVVEQHWGVPAATIEGEHAPEQVADAALEFIKVSLDTWDESREQAH